MKSCPFCGSKADLLGYPGDKATRSSATFSAKCSSCGAETATFPTKQEAINAWDARSGLADANPLAAWIDLHSGVIVHTESEAKKPQIHGFSLLNPEPNQREFYRLCNWKLLRTYFRDPQ